MVNYKNLRQMKKFLLLSAILVAAIVYSQTNCETLKKENETLLTTNKILNYEKYNYPSVYFAYFRHYKYPFVFRNSEVKKSRYRTRENIYRSFG